MRNKNLNAIAKFNHLDAIIAQHEILKEFHDTKVKPLESLDNHRGESALLTQSDTITNFAVTLQWKTQSENQDGQRFDYFTKGNQPSCRRH